MDMLKDYWQLIDYLIRHDKQLIDTLLIVLMDMSKAYWPCTDVLIESHLNTEMTIMHEVLLQITTTTTTANKGL